LEHYGQEITMAGSDTPFPLSEMMTQGFEWRIQTEFMQAQWKAFTEQTKELAESATKSATKVMKGSS
jgi:hypothetical protein